MDHVKKKKTVKKRPTSRNSSIEAPSLVSNQSIKPISKVNSYTTCNCTVCRKLHHDSTMPSRKRRPSDSSTATSSSCQLTNGERVFIAGHYPGIVKYIGPLRKGHQKSTTFVGVKLFDNVHSIQTGIISGKSFFHCPLGHGALVPLSEVAPLPPVIPRPKVYGNSMFPSYAEIRTNRKRLKKKYPDLYSSWYALPSPPEQKSRPKSSKEQSTSASKSADVVDEEEEDLKKWFIEFGGDERAARMVGTLRKLQLGREIGRRILSGEPELESETQGKKKEKTAKDTSDSDSDDSDGSDAQHTKSGSDSD